MRTMRRIGLIVLACVLASVAMMITLMTWVGPAAGVLVGLAIASAVILIYVTVIGPWQRRWGATPWEVARALPGDELLRPDAPSTTRAITINGPLEAVFPWLLQSATGVEAGTATTGSITTAARASTGSTPSSNASPSAIGSRCFRGWVPSSERSGLTTIS